jgi:predicted phosphodiesterase
LEIRDFHKSQDCYIVVGEILSGLIHNNLRLQNNMDLMEQFKYVAELISSMFVELAKGFNHVYMYTTPGNHSRIVAKKEDSLDGENMDLLLPFYLKARLQNIKNISICDNNIDPEIAMFDIRGNNIFSAHGHKDSPKSVVQNFTMLFGIKPNIVLLGHRHTNALSTVYDTKVIESGCVSGSDDWIVSNRKANKPEQTVSVIDTNGLKCLYDIQLD